MFPFIVVEGLSACGKTTVGRILADKMNAVFYKTPAPIFCPAREGVDMHASLMARYFFYLAGVIQASSEIKEILNHNAVVCDRYLLTTTCYHEAMGVPVSKLTPDIQDVIVAPDLNVLICCSEEIRKARLNSRGRSYNDLVEEKSGIAELFLAEYERHNVLTVDNSTSDVMVAVSRILEEIEK